MVKGHVLDEGLCFLLVLLLHLWIKFSGLSSSPPVVSTFVCQATSYLELIVKYFLVLLGWGITPMQELST
jgi:hypothetical protein